MVASYISVWRSLDTVPFPKGVQVNLFKCRSIQKGSSTQASYGFFFYFPLHIFFSFAFFCHSPYMTLLYDDLRQHDEG